MELRPYQLDILASIENAFTEGFRKVLISSPTGSGKTVVFSKLAEKHINGKVLVLVNREELLTQAASKIHATTGIIPAIERAHEKASLNADCVVASIQSMQKRIQKYRPEHFGLVICDEAHLSVSKQWQDVLQHFAKALVVGFSATCFRSDSKDLMEYYETIAYELGIFDLIEQGYLSPIKVQTLDIQIDLNKVRTKLGDFKDDDLDDAISPFFREVSLGIKTHAADRKTLVFLPLIRSSQKFVSICNEIGISARHIDGACDDRAMILQQYRRGDFQLLANSALLSTGYDEPEISCIVNLRPTKSTGLFQQEIGRGTRLFAGKKDLLILDVMWDYAKHGLVRPAHLIASNQEEADAITRKLKEWRTPLELEEVAKQVQREREEAILLEAARLQKMHDKARASMMDAQTLSALLHQPKLLNYEPVAKWEKRPMSEKQETALRKRGIDTATIKGMGHAGKVLDAIFGRDGLAPFEALLPLRERGIEHPETMSLDDAIRVLRDSFPIGFGRHISKPFKDIPQSYWDYTRKNHSIMRWIKDTQPACARYMAFLERQKAPVLPLT